jgi:hypothetical protein
MSFSVLINGLEYNENTFRNTMEIREAMQMNGSGMSATVQLTDDLPVPTGGNEIRVYKDDVLEFAGRIKNVDPSFASFAMQYGLDCADYTPDFDSQFISETFDENNIGDTVRVIIGYVGRGFTSNNVENGPDIGEVVMELEAPSGVITRLAEGIEHQWYVDYERDVHFFYIKNRPAPVPTLDFDTDLVNYSNLTPSEDVSQVKNVIYLTGVQVKSRYNAGHAWIADGDTRFFPLGYQPVGLNETIVRVNGAPQTLKLDTRDGQMGDGATDDGSVYLCIDNWGIRWADNSPPAELAQLDVSYKYVVDTTVKVEEPRSIEMMRLRENTPTAPSNGRHEFKFEVPDLGLQDNEGPVVDYGNLLLSRYAFPRWDISFDSLTQGWQRGQTFYGQSTRHGFATDFYITSVTKRLYQSSDGITRFAYNLEASSSPFPG